MNYRCWDMFNFKKIRDDSIPMSPELLLGITFTLYQLNKVLKRLSDEDKKKFLKSKSNDLTEKKVSELLSALKESEIFLQGVKFSNWMCEEGEKSE